MVYSCVHEANQEPRRDQLARPVTREGDMKNSGSTQHAGAEAPLAPPADRHDAVAIVDWALRRFRDWKVVATSGLGMEGCVLLDLLDRAAARLDVLFIDTGFHFEETLELREQLTERYPRLNIVSLASHLSPEDQAMRYGDALWRRDPDRCCDLRKVRPLEPALRDVDVWFTGLRRSQNPSRARIDSVEWDWERQLLKVHPLARWSREEVWTYARENDVPTNPLHEKGFPSIGCTHCTERVPGAAPTDDTRAGRWAGFEKTECGLHTAGAPLPHETGAAVDPTPHRATETPERT